MTNLNTAHKRRQYEIVEDDLSTSVTTKWKRGFELLRNYEFNDRVFIPDL